MKWKKSAYVIYRHTHLYHCQEKLESTFLLLLNVSVFAQTQYCTHRNQESYHLCKRDEFYKLKYYIFFKHRFSFPFVRAPESSIVLALPGTGSPGRDCTSYLLHVWLLSLQLPHIHLPSSINFECSVSFLLATISHSPSHT